MGLSAYLTLAAVVFCVGLFGSMTRRNTVGILLGIELMLNAVNINLVAFARFSGSATGIVFSVFTICITVSEAANFLLYFAALSSGDSATGSVTHYLAPVFVAIAAPMFGDRLGRRVLAESFSRLGTMRLAEGVAARSQRHSFLRIHRHAREGRTHVPS